MTDSHSTVGDALFTKTQQRVLGLLYGKTEQSYYLNEVVRLAGIGKGTVKRELGRLVDAGLLTVTKQGNQNHYQADPDNPVFDELKSIVKKTLGVVDVLVLALEPFLTKIELAFVYGSVAKGSEHAESDIDLMLVGEDLDFSDILGALIPVAEQLQREINPTILTLDELNQRIAAKQSFITRVLEQDKLWLVGEDRLG